MKKVFLLLFVIAVIFLSLMLNGCQPDKKTATPEITSAQTTEASDAVAVKNDDANLTSDIITEVISEESAGSPAIQTDNNQGIANIEKNDTQIAAPNASTDDYLITINLDTNKLTLFKGQEKVSAYSVATGKIVDGKSLTPSTQAYVFEKIKDRPWYGGGYADPIAGGADNNPLGHYWMGLSIKGHSGIGIHGNIDADSIGKSVSHGCIRMNNDEVKQLYNIVSVDTMVWIGTSGELTEWGATNFE